MSQKPGPLWTCWHNFTKTAVISNWRYFIAVISIRVWRLLSRSLSRGACALSLRALL